MDTSTTSIQLIYSVRDRFFETQNLHKHDLAIRLAEDEMSFAITQIDEKKVILLKAYRIIGMESLEDWESNVYSFFESQAFFKEKFNSVKIVAQSPQFTIVPDEFFDVNKKEELLGFEVPVAPYAEVFVDTVSGLNLSVLFALPDGVLSAIKKVFSSFELSHGAAHWLRVSNFKVESNSSYILAHANKGSLDVSCFEKGKLLLHNTYQITTGEDLLYFLLNAAKISSMSPKELKLCIWGVVNDTQNSGRLLNNYFGSVEYGNRPSQKSYCEELNVVPQQALFHLLSL